MKVPGNIAPHFVTSRSRCPRATSTSVPRGREHLTLAVEECSVMFVETCRDEAHRGGRDWDDALDRAAARREIIVVFGGQRVRMKFLFLVAPAVSKTNACLSSKRE